MASRPIWRGHLRLALVSCPVALISARHERNNLHFHFINPETNNRVRMVTQDAETGAELKRGELVRGYEFKKDHYVLLSDEDFESARIESSTVLTVDKFVERDRLDPIYFDSAYFLVPDGEAGIDVYAVLREAIAEANVMALSRVVLSRRERAVAIVAHGRGLVLHTLHETSDLTDPDEAFEALPDDTPDPSMVTLAGQLIERQAGEYDPSDVSDRYEARLRELIQAKVEGTGIEPEDPEPPGGGKVIDLMDALRRSLGQDGKGEAAPPSRPMRAAPATAAKRKEPDAGAAKAKAGSTAASAAPAKSKRAVQPSPSPAATLKSSRRKARA